MGSPETERSLVERIQAMIEAESGKEVDGKRDETASDVHVALRNRITSQEDFNEKARYVLIVEGDVAVFNKLRGMYGHYSVDLSNVDLSGRNLRGIFLNGAQLSGANLSKADLFGTIFAQADLTDADLSGVDAEAANFIMANLMNANLSGANLKAANFNSARLSGVNFSESNLSRANFELLQLNDSDLSNAAFDNASFDSVGVTAEKLATAAKLDGISVSSETLLTRVRRAIELMAEREGCDVDPRVLASIRISNI